MEIGADKKVAVNRMITARQLRVIGADGEQLGIMEKHNAIAAAEDLGLDLVEVAPTSDPPVCRIMDYGKFKYEQSKKAQVSKKKQKIIQVKEIKVRPKTDSHDLETKAKHARKFLSEGNKIKVTVRFRGREIVHTDRGYLILNKFMELLQDVASVESPAKMEGRNMIMVLTGSAQQQG
ncbi:MAG: translation initiation factor IF-3 [bacterium]|nr:translation initiation factor IF-3 [bacterium]MDT8395672.1 translation initiation factor IF-3 [bacterium]